MHHETQSHRVEFGISFFFFFFFRLRISGSRHQLTCTSARGDSDLPTTSCLRILLTTLLTYATVCKPPPTSLLILFVFHMFLFVVCSEFLCGPNPPPSPTLSFFSLRLVCFVVVFALRFFLFSFFFSNRRDVKGHDPPLKRAQIFFLFFFQFRKKKMRSTRQGGGKQV